MISLGMPYGTHVICVFWFFGSLEQNALPYYMAHGRLLIADFLETEYASTQQHNVYVGHAESLPLPDEKSKQILSVLFFKKKPIPSFKVKP
jgi:hypothetical protein